MLSDRLGLGLFQTLLLFAVAQALSYVVAGWIQNTFGIIPTFIYSILINGGLMLGYQVLFESYDNSNSTPPFIVFCQFVVIVIAFFMINISFGTGYNWTVSVFPVKLRGSIMGICNFVGRTGAVAAPEVAWLSSTPLIIFGITSVASGVLVVVFEKVRKVITDSRS